MTRNIILLSGGPGLFDRADPEHDASWANYVTPILLQTQTAEQRRAFKAADEEVWWFIYKPAYERRWSDDVSRSDREHEPRRIRRIRCGDHNCTSYVDLLEWRARERGWNLRWISHANQFWSRLATFRDPISRVFYWGHARDDLWLTVEHDRAHRAIAPATHEIVTVGSIAGNSALRARFQPGSSSRRHVFFGCNTHSFAQEWARVFGVHTRGFEGTLSFSSVARTGQPEPATGCRQRDFASDGAAETAIELDPELHSIEVFGAVELHPESQLADERTDEDKAIDFDSESGFDLVALADEAIVSGLEKPSATDLLGRLLGETGAAGALGSQNGGVSLSPAALFDACTGGRPSVQRFIEQYFEIVARPGERLEQDLQPGDLYLRRALGEDRLAHLAVLSTGGTVRERNIASNELRVEGKALGWYAEVVETGAAPHAMGDRFARRVADENGHMSRDSLILRLRRANSP